MPMPMEPLPMDTDPIICLIIVSLKVLMMQAELGHTNFVLNLDGFNHSHQLIELELKESHYNLYKTYARIHSTLILALMKCLIILIYISEEINSQPLTL